MYNYDYFINKFPNIATEMKKTQQDKIWHAEGDVLIHTQMVLNKLINFKEYQELDQLNQKILAYATFFHDIAKFDTTVIIDGRVRSPSHSKIGEKKTRILLKSLNYDFYFREQVCMLIRYHGYPVYFFEKNENDIIKMSLILNNSLLYLLCKADMLGRISLNDDIDEHIMNVDYFKEIAIKNDCFYHPKSFQSNSQKMRFLYHGDMYIPFNENKSKVYLMSALPGSGKDYYINKHLSHLKVISLDDLRRKYNIKHGDKKGLGRIIQEAKLTAKKYLANHIDFVWNATNVSLPMRQSLLSLFYDYKASVEIIYIEKDTQTLFKQNKNREFSVPEDAITKLFRNIDIPTQNEAEIVRYVI